MGRIKNKFKEVEMSDDRAIEIIETQTADCPGLELTLAGTEDETTLSADVSAFSDGATISPEVIFGATYYASMETDTELMLAFGTEATLSTAPNGAYSICLDFAWNATDEDVDVTGQIQGYYMDSAAVEVATTLNYYDCATYVAIYAVDGSGDLVNPEYGWTVSDTMTGDGDLVEGDDIVATWYLPKDSDTDGETGITGDRINHKDKVSAFAGDGEPTAICATDIKVKLGAASLAATSLALAAAMTM